MTDLYEVLGVPRHASQEEIEDAYRNFARHPEHFFGNIDLGRRWPAERGAEIQHAYDVLSDPAKRAAYDATLDPTGFAAASERSPMLREPEQPTRGGYVPPPTEVRRRHTRNPIDRLTQNLPRGWRIAIDWIVTIAGAIGIVLLIKAYVVNPYRIPSSSMEPTLHCARSGSGCLAHFSDRVLANRFIYHLRDPRRGEIIVFKTPPQAAQRCGAGGTFVKRLIGLPGETIQEKLIDGRGYIFINARRLDEPYVKPERRDSMTYGPYAIPKGMYFMMGDNRIQSCDSRQWGPVPRKNLIGEVFFVYWPPNRIGFR